MLLKTRILFIFFILTKFNNNYLFFSPGGSEWTLEDTIELKNINLPDIRSNIDLSVIYNNDVSKLPCNLLKSTENLLDEHMQNVVENSWSPQRSISPSPSSNSLSSVLIPSQHTIQVRGFSQLATFSQVYKRYALPDPPPLSPFPKCTTKMLIL